MCVIPFFKYFLHQVVHFLAVGVLTHLPQRFCLVLGASCVFFFLFFFVSVMVAYNFLACEMHLGCVFVTLVTPTAKHDVIRPQGSALV